MKVDLCSNSTSSAMLWSKPLHASSEAIFVGNPEGTVEDDGVLLSTVRSCALRLTKFLPVCLWARGGDAFRMVLYDADKLLA